MRHYMLRVSAFCFYALGISFFIAYLLHYNSIGGPIPQWWMLVADMPLGFSAALFGGMSFYNSLLKDEQDSKTTATVIFGVLGAVFAFFFVLNYWPLFAA